MFDYITRSLRGKLMLVVLATTFCALAFVALALAVYEVRTYDTALIDDLNTQAEILGRASETALAFGDRRVATENLAALRLRPHMKFAALYAHDGSLFATYPAGATDVPASPGADGNRIAGETMVLFHPVIAQGKRVGTLYLSTRYELTARIVDTLTILAAVMLASLGIAAAVSAWLQGVVTRPILEVAGVAREVIERRDFTLRARTQTRDEIGYLVQAFNDMLGEVGQRAEALEAAYQKLQHEIDERRAAEAALRIADKRKDEFLATLAHELRNPLAPLRNGLDILRKPNAPPERVVPVLDLMSRQLGQLVRLVDDLLDVSRISTGKLSVRLERVALADVVDSAVEMTRPLIESRGQHLAVDVPAQPVALDADATRLAQVLGNLLNNATKYTPQGGRVALTAQLKDRVVEIAVADSGTGIPADMIDRVFEMFTQVDTSLDRMTAGLGVGLTLARRLTELHGGTIEARSAGPGQGSTFTLRLPLAAGDVAERHASGAAAETTESAAPDAVAAHRRVLLADDNVDYASSLALILRSLGHEVVVTHDGAEALAAARDFRPSVAFLDIGLPKLHGYALARELRNHPSTRGTVLVAITGWGQDRDRQQAREAGFDHHFVKPVGVDQLLAVLAKS